MAQAHLLVAGRGAQERMARLEGEAFFKLIPGQLDLILIVVNASAMVVEDRCVCRVELESLVEGAPGAHHVNLAAKAVPRILQLGNAKAGPRRCKACNAKRHV